MAPALGSGTAARARGGRWTACARRRAARSPRGRRGRDDVGGAHFDPRTVALKFDVQGEHGVYLPCALDLRERTLHWLDVASKGELAFNNVATANKAITTVCPRLISYFGSGVGGAVETCVRRPDEAPAAFLRRLRDGEVDASSRAPDLERPCLAALYRGDVVLPAGSLAHALFREGLTAPMAAADLLS